MRPLTSQFSASVARRDQVVKKTCVGAVPRTAAATASASSRSAASVRDPLVETLRATAQARDLPAVGEQALREVPPADARDADDECASAHCGFRRQRRAVRTRTRS